MSIPINTNPLGIKNELFQLTVKITDAPNQTLDLSQYTNAESNAILKDWGDGIINNAKTHQYTENGTYTVSLSNPNNVTLNNFIPWRDNSKNFVVGCNWKWDSLGDIRRIVSQSQLSNYSTWEKGICTKLPSTLTSMEFFFAYQASLPCYITSIPNGVTSLYSCGNMNSNAIFIIDKLPPNITTLHRAFRYSSNESIIDIGKIVKNAPVNGFQQLIQINDFATADTGKINLGTGGTIAQFMNKCPNVTIIKTNGTSNPFSGNREIQIFGENDHFECIVNIPSDNYVWGFTPISSGGTWYLIQWGDSTISSTSPYKANNSLYTFTSGTKVEHTYAKAGTYTIKLCTHTDSITFDSVVSHNNQLQFLGNVNGVGFN